MRGSGVRSAWGQPSTVAGARSRRVGVTDGRAGRCRRAEAWDAVYGLRVVRGMWRARCRHAARYAFVASLVMPPLYRSRAACFGARASPDLPSSGGSRRGLLLYLNHHMQELGEPECHRVERVGRRLRQIHHRRLDMAYRRRVLPVHGDIRTRQHQP